MLHFWFWILSYKYIPIHEYTDVKTITASPINKAKTTSPEPIIIIKVNNPKINIVKNIGKIKNFVIIDEYKKAL